MKALRVFQAHVRELWPRYALLPLVPFAAYALFSAAKGDLRVEHIGALLLVIVPAYTGKRSKALLVAMYPFGLVGLFYDAMRPLQRVGLSPERVHLCDVRALESMLFGYSDGGAPRTLHDYFHVHHAAPLDLLCAFPYATFIFVSMACAAFLAFRDRQAMKRFTWGFFAMNVAGFATYHLFPAAPPWYFHAHGCEIDLATRASEGPALARVDAMLGVAYFHGMYSKASSVFGAIPSLHCAYPLLVVLEGWRSFGPRLRALSVGYWLLMVLSAVYLDHHWVIDAVVGSAFAVIASLALRRLVPSVPTASVITEADRVAAIAPRPSPTLAERSGAAE